jgi:two-component system cell cycle sensor histidine kinase/response regulator CckA
LKVLVVDDHPTVRQMATRLLACLGHTPLEARDAAEAEDALSSSDGVDVILIDLHLDGMDGAALAHRLEAGRSNLHILFMSGVGKEVFAARDLSGPRRAFIEKPFSLNRLDLALQGLVAR